MKIGTLIEIIFSPDLFSDIQPIRTIHIQEISPFGQCWIYVSFTFQFPKVPIMTGAGRNPPWGAQTASILLSGCKNSHSTNHRQAPAPITHEDPQLLYSKSSKIANFAFPYFFQTKDVFALTLLGKLFSLIFRSCDAAAYQEWFQRIVQGVR